ncbi:MAG: hypothetical protein CM1200mP26_16100 [Acidimicrobiales bacterium]|nr:MAG: hypothetical protein CM1200mP26_16100 [Acidimicrobiales bacterium]
MSKGKPVVEEPVASGPTRYGVPVVEATGQIVLHPEVDQWLTP